MATAIPEIVPEATRHWSLVPPERPEEPAVSDRAWPRNAIDRFVLARLDTAGLTPAPEAEAQALVRRVALDLTGLPPTPEDVVAFVADPSDAAYESYVERLLADEAFGEQRARYWLDAARYADTGGYHYDNYRSVWPYRDYVIRAFNRGVPFDRFTIEQLAGDLLPDASEETRIATGFIRNAMSTTEAGIVDDEYAAIYAKDRVETLGAVWLGLTLGCASCHDHKYDPISQRDFYALAAFFRNSSQPILDQPNTPTPPTLQLADGNTTLISDEQASPARAYLLLRGRYDAPGELLQAHVPDALPALPADAPANRLGLARWLVAADNPLVARVTINRFWSELFGVGLVRSAHDFGKTGEAPSHPELLDWLAVEFRESGWDVKHMLRLFVSSSSYRQAARSSRDSQERDPDNRLLSRGPSFRMDAEMLRDLALSASGLLVRKVGGPSVRPYQPEGLWEAVSAPDSDTARYVQGSGDQLYRRSLYTFWKRQAPPPAMEILNAPSREQSVVQRERTNTPLQALVTMNEPGLIEAARVLAEHALSAERSDERRLIFMALRILAREPTPEEQLVLLDQLELQRRHFAELPGQPALLAKAGERPAASGLDATDVAAFTLLANLLFNLDQALTK